MTSPGWQAVCPDCGPTPAKDLAVVSRPDKPSRLGFQCGGCGAYVIRDVAPEIVAALVACGVRHLHHRPPLTYADYAAFMVQLDCLPTAKDPRW